MDSSRFQFEISSLLSEEFNYINYVNEDVLVSEDQKTNRITQLTKALKKGVSEKTQSRIVFATDKGLKKLESIILRLDEDEVRIQSGICIPIHAICFVKNL